MRTIEVLRKVRLAVVLGAVLTTALGGCVVREHTEQAVPYPVEVGRRGPAPAWGHGPHRYGYPNRFNYQSRGYDHRPYNARPGWEADRRPTTHGPRMRDYD